ncbi:MAG: hypothetical protein AB1467_03255 [Candidatus Diapherotrites archaeon]
MSINNNVIKFTLILFLFTIFASTASALHTSTAELQPEWSPAGEPVNYTVTFCNDGTSTHDVDEVRIYRNMSYTNFVCDDKAGWEKYFISAKQACQYVAIDSSSGNYISPGECEDFTFSATTPQSGCEFTWDFETRDLTFPNTGSIQYLSDTTSVDDMKPMLIKTLGDPKIQNEETWITQQTPIHIEAYDQGECGISGLNYCEYRYDVDGVEVLPWTQIQWQKVQLGQPPHYHYTFNYQEDSNHYLEIRCYDIAGNMAYHEQWEKVDDTPPVTTKQFTGPQKIDGLVEWIDGITTVTLNPTDPDPTTYDCNIGVDKTWYRNDWYVEGEGTAGCYDPQNYCNEQWYSIVSPYTMEEYPGCIDYWQEQCLEAGSHGSTEWFDCMDYWLYEDCSITNWKLYRGNPIQKEEESCHIMSFFSVDYLGNKEDLNMNCFFVDKTPPMVIKDNGNAIPGTGEKMFVTDDNPNGDFHWITTEMPVTFTCDDSWGKEAPHPSGDEELCYKVSYDYPEWDYITEDYCSTELNKDGYCCVPATVKDPFEFYFNEESMHNLEYYCIDAVEKKSDVHVQYYKVDDTPPLIEKYMIGDYNGDCPYGTDLEHGDCFVADNGSSGVEIYAYDPEPHPVGVDVEKCRYALWWHTTEQECYDAGYNEYDPINGRCAVEAGSIDGSQEIFFQEDSTHDLVIYCYDRLGNLAQDEEVFLVDSTPPVTTKWYEGPQYPNPILEGETPYPHWINSSTLVHLEAEDEKVGVGKIYWRNTLVDNIYCFTEFSGCQNAEGLGLFQEYLEPFNKPEESCHLIEYYAVDKLGNEEQIKKQCVFVDNTEPIVSKTVGDPKVECGGTIVLDFEDLPGQGQLPSNYAGLTWSPDWWHYDWPQPPYTPHSGVVILYDFDPNAYIIFPQPTTFEGAWFAGGYNPDYFVMDDFTYKTGGNAECDYYVTQQTPIYLNCEDTGNHPVNNVKAFYRTYFCDQEPPAEWTEYPIDTIYFGEDSCHKLDYYCEDALGNKTDTYTETDFVDSVAPDINKIIIGPQYGQCPPRPDSDDECYIDTATEIHVNAIDPESHPVNDVTCNWSYEVIDDDKSDGEQGVKPPFIIKLPEESRHALYIECWDALGNRARDYEEFIVDKTPPVTTKRYGEPFYPNQISDWISSLTPIYFSAYDPEPHPSGVKATYYRISLVDDTYCDGINEDKNYDLSCEDAPTPDSFFDVFIELSPPTIPEESCHLIEYYSVDNVDKTEEPKRQCVFVDNTAPIPDKNVGEPKSKWDGSDSVYYPEETEYCWATENGIECWKITLLTPVKLGCVDQAPHPVDNEGVCFRVEWDKEDMTENYCEQYQGDMKENGFCCVNKEIEFMFNKTSEHELEYYCVDALGNSNEQNLDVEKFKVEDTKFEIQINKKWNLISVPVVLLDDDPEVVFSNISECIESVWAYDGESEEWYVFTPNDAPDNLESITPGWGYWVLGKDDCTLVIGGSLMNPGPTPQASKKIVSGWNLIGYYGADGMEGYYGPYGNGGQSYCELYSLGEDLWDKEFTGLWTYWEPDNPNQWKPLSRYNNMDPGAGYWLATPQEGLYTSSTDCGWWD